jgi:3-hydroxybutyryl-CoA dehydratase
MVLFPGKAYDEIKVGDSFDSAMTVTETHLVLASGRFGDFNPPHVDELHAKQRRFGSRILHGPFTRALVSAPVGRFFGGTAIAYLEHTCRFKAPVRAGDTLTTAWTIVEKHKKPGHKGGIAVLSGVCRNQDGDVVEADGKILVKSREKN